MYTESQMVSTLTAALIPSADSAPAGGAALDQVAIASVMALALGGFVVWLGAGHRSGRVRYLGRAAAWSERITGLPGWAALPSLVSAASLLVALLGMYWDISFHIDAGRDPGPLANPAHYLILFGLFGIFTAGYFAVSLPEGRPGPAAVHLVGNWYAPVGGLLIAACGAFSLAGFPLDDLWHRLFGQDVTLWGPTHLMLIGGAAMTLVGLAVLLVEARRATAADGGRGELGWVGWMRRVSLPRAFLPGLSAFQGEFDFGVPQFRLVFHPMLMMLAAGVSFVAARVWLGRGSALGAAVFFLALRGIIALLVGPVLGQPVPHFPLYLAEAALVELVALRIGPRRRPLAFALACGALMGTVGLAAEWGWTRLWFPLPWPAALFPEGFVLGLAMALAGSALGAW